MWYHMVPLGGNGQISQPQSPRQETFWASAGFESTEESETLSDTPRQLANPLHSNIKIY